MMNFWRQTTHFWLFSRTFRQRLDNQTMFMENLPKRGPLFREFWPKNSPIWAAHTSVCHVPPAGVMALCFDDSFNCSSLIHFTSRGCLSVSFHSKTKLCNSTVGNKNFRYLETGCQIFIDLCEWGERNFLLVQKILQY